MREVPLDVEVSVVGRGRGLADEKSLDEPEAAGERLAVVDEVKSDESVLG
jgi:hypothetical protein